MAAGSADMTAQADAVSYIERSWDGTAGKVNESTKSCTDYTVVAAGTTTFENDKWYVVNSNVTVSQRITVEGAAHLILCDGATLTANGGIAVTEGKTLNVYPGSASNSVEGTGILTAKSSSDNAASVGGDSNGKDCGTVVFHGGVVDATGGSGAAGIGGGAAGNVGGNGGTVTIYGGKVTAASPNDGSSGAGIGGGYGNSSAGAGGTVTIYGGEVSATGSYHSAGIGGGSTGTIGGAGGTVNIYGGTVTATGGGVGGAGIGAGYHAGTNSDIVNIYGGNVNAKSKGEGYGIGCYDDGQVGAVHIYGGNVYASTEYNNMYGIGYGLTVHEGVTMEYSFDNNQWWSYTGTRAQYMRTTPPPDPVAYQAWNETKGAVENVEGGCTNYTVVTADTTTFEDGKWYVVNGADVQNNNRIEVNGTANLILCDGAKLTASKGIHVTTGKTLNIYAQSDGETKGKLYAGTTTGEDATCDNGNAGIGKNYYSDGTVGGTVTIHGGNVYAVGGTQAAGIGSSYSWDFDAVTIYGGTVNAIGGGGDISQEIYGGAGIGGGWQGDINTVSIYGGDVTATGGLWAAGIGGGKGGNAKNVVINGGTVNATGSEFNGAGIGGGHLAGGGTVTINGGTVTANGGNSGAGIGGGYGAIGATVTVNGGTVTAQGGYQGAGIGGGKDGAGGHVAINGGTVTATGGTGALGIGKGQGATNVGTISLGEGVTLQVSSDGTTWKKYNNTSSDLTKYMRTTPSSYSVALSGGANATTSGAITQSVTQGQTMATVTYTAASGYHFAEFTDITSNGVTATRTSDTVVTVSGTPTADVNITIPDAELIPVVDVTGVSFEASSATLTVGDKTALSVTIEPADATDKTVKWSVGGANASAVKLYSDKECKTEVSTGVATDVLTVYAKGESAGTATVTVTSNADSAKTATCTVTVSPITYAIALPTTVDNATVSGETTQEVTSGTAMTDVTYTAAEGYVFPKTNSAYGEFSGVTVAVSADQKTITVSGTPTDDVSITAIPAAGPAPVAVSGVSFDATSATLTVGEKTMLSVTIEPADATDKTVKWSVGGENASAVKLYSDEACEHEVGVDATDVLTVYAKGESKGTATITVTSNADPEKTATCTVTVNPVTYTVSLSDVAHAIVSGEPKQTVEAGEGMTVVTYTAESGYYFEPFTDKIENGVKAHWASDTNVTVSGTPTGNVNIEIPNAKVDDAVPYWYYTITGGTSSTQLNTDGRCREYTIVTENTTVFAADKWYVVDKDVKIDYRINVAGEAHLILCDGVTLTAEKGVKVSQGNKLNIYTQSLGDNRGKLVAGPAEDNNAGIGGNDKEAGGTVVVHGGDVTATGGKNAAGIGGGSNGNGGILSVCSGTVTATGGFSDDGTSSHAGAGIGGGDNGKGGEVNIYGGLVNATGGSVDVESRIAGGAGIGGGNMGNGGTVHIYGGGVNAQGGKGAVAIGAGNKTAGTPDNGTLAIASTVTVYGDDNPNPTHELIPTDEGGVKVIEARPTYMASTSPVDKTALEKGIGDANTYHTDIAESHPDIAKELKDAIVHATGVKDSPTATQDEVNNEVDAINKALEKAIDDVKKAAKADAVKKQIEDLPTPEDVTKDNKDDIEKAREAYDGLDDDQKKRVGEDALKKLEADEKALEDEQAADAVEKRIQALPDPQDVTKRDKGDIEKAREAYNDLTDDQKKRVDEELQDKLSDDEVALAKELIEDLPEPTKVTTGDKDAIDKAREAYDALTPDQQSQVGKELRKKLEADEKALAEASDKAAVKAAADKINALPPADKVTTADKAAIEDARAAYDALTMEQRAMLDEDPSILAYLMAAEEALKAAESAAPIDKAVISKIDDQLYTAAPIEPAFEVTLDGKKLAAGTDYDAKFDNNVEVSTATGAATVTVTGKGAYKGTVTATFKITSLAKKEAATRMADLDAMAWYMGGDGTRGGFFGPESDTLYMDYTLAKGLISGYKDEAGNVTGFRPDTDLTRAQAAVIVYRMANPGSTDTYSDAAAAGIANANKSTLPDVEDGRYYTAAVNWCVANGVVTGYTRDDGTPYAFGPEDGVTREQLATIIGRYMDPQGAAGADVSGFEDSAKMSGYARAGIAYCNANGIMTGIGGTKAFDPQGNASRCQMAKVIAVTDRLRTAK